MSQPLFPNVFLRKLKVITLMFALTILAAACSNGSKVTNHSSNTNLSELNTYRWQAQRDFVQTGPGGGDTNFDDVVMRAVNQELIARGYQLKHSGQVDFTLDFRVFTNQRLVANSDEYGHAEGDRNEYGLKWSFGEGSSDKEGYQGLSKPREDQRVIQDGILHVGAFSNNGSLIWHTSGKQILSENRIDGNQTASMQHLVTSIMERFPGKQAQ